MSYHSDGFDPHEGFKEYIKQPSPPRSMEETNLAKTEIPTKRPHINQQNYKPPEKKSKILDERNNDEITLARQDIILLEEQIRKFSKMMTFIKSSLKPKSNINMNHKPAKILFNTYEKTLENLIKTYNQLLQEHTESTAKYNKLVARSKPLKITSRKRKST